MLNIKCNQSTTNLYNLLRPDLPENIDGMSAFFNILINKMNEFPYADIELLKAWFEIEAIDKHLININQELNLGNTAVISRQIWLETVFRHKELFKNFYDKYAAIKADKHWHWGERVEWKEHTIGEIDPRSGEKYTEVFADRAMSNFELWFEFGKYPKCQSSSIEKGDGENKIGVCLGCNNSHEYDKNYRYYNDIPSVLRPKVNTEYSRAVEYAKKYKWL